MLRNISFKKPIINGLLAIAPFLSLLMRGLVALAQMLYKLLSYCLPLLWKGLIFLLLIIPYGLFLLYNKAKDFYLSAKEDSRSLTDRFGSWLHSLWNIGLPSTTTFLGKVKAALLFIPFILYALVVFVYTAITISGIWLYKKVQGIPTPTRWWVIALLAIPFALYALVVLAYTLLIFIGQQIYYALKKFCCWLPYGLSVALGFFFDTLAKGWQYLRYLLQYLWQGLLLVLIGIPYGIGLLFRRKEGKKPKTYKFYLKWAGIAIGSVVAMVSLLVALVYFGVFGKLPTKQELKELKQAEASLIYDDSGEFVGKFYIFDRTKIDYTDFPPYLVNALIATEDERFYEHSGIDTRSLLRVFFKTLLLQDDASGGGSTLTMQLAKNIFGRADRYGKLTMPVHKIKEMIIAHRIESVYSKEEIITLYLNTVPFSDNTYGIEAASYRFFSKPTKALTLNEAATLIGTLKANNSYNPRTAPQRSEERRNVVLAQMKKNGLLTETDFQAHKKDSLKIEYNGLENEGIAPYLREQIRLQLPNLLKDITKDDGTPYNIYKDGLRIYTTINRTMQEYAEGAVRKHLARLQKDFELAYGKNAPWKLDNEWLKQEAQKLPAYKQLKANGLTEEQIWDKLSQKKAMDLSFYEKDKVQMHSTLDSLSFFSRLLNTGFVAVNPQTGAIKSYVGGIDFQYFKYDHVLQSKRQVGSIFKPIVYATALEQGMPVCTHFSPRALTYADEKFWTPRNSSSTDDDPYTYYSVGKALKESLNTIAVQTLFYAGLEKVIAKAKAMGISSHIPSVPSIALGSAELPVIEMAKAYTTFANNGVPSQPYFIEKITDKKGKVLWEYKPKKEAPALTETTTQQMLQLMRATVNEGTASRMRGQYGLTNDLAGKTGTTQDNKDGWFAGLLPNLVMISWVGNDQQIGFRSTRLGQGANSALPIAALFVSQLNRNKKFKDITQATFTIDEELKSEILSCEPVIREGFLDRLFSTSTTVKDTVAAGELHYRIYERSSKLHSIDNPDEDISIDDVVPPTTKPTTTSTQEQEEDKPKKKGFFGRIFK